VENWKGLALKRVCAINKYTIGEPLFDVMVAEVHSASSMASPIVRILSQFDEDDDIVRMGHATFREKVDIAEEKDAVRKRARLAHADNSSALMISHSLRQSCGANNKRKPMEHPRSSRCRLGIPKSDLL